MTGKEAERRLGVLKSAERLLVYGGGYLAASQLPLMAGVGLKVAGVIDKYKTGALKYKGGELPIYSIAEAATTFGPDTTVLLAVNAKWHDEVRRDLAAAGFAAANTIDWQDLTEWLTVPSDKCCCEVMYRELLYCAYGFESCRDTANRVAPFFLYRYSKNKEFAVMVDELIDKLNYYREEAEKGRIPLHCAGCRNLQDKPSPKAIKIPVATFAVHTLCTFNCSYCGNVWKRYDGKGEFFDSREDMANFVYLVETFAERGLFAEKAEMLFAGGELSVLPNKGLFLDFLRKHPQYWVCVTSNCSVYSEEIAEMLSLNPRSFLMCDLDAGTRETYLMIKGVDCFERTIANIKRYKQRCRNVVLKYIIVPALNTSEAEYLGQIRILKELGITRFIISRDESRYDFSDNETRKMLFEAAKFQAMLAAHGIEPVSISFFLPHEKEWIARYYKQLLKIYAPPARNSARTPPSC